MFFLFAQQLILTGVRPELSKPYLLIKVIQHAQRDWEPDHIQIGDYLHLLRGGDLKNCRTPQSQAAGKLLSTVIAGENYIYNGNTCPNVFLQLDDEAKKRCTLYTVTGEHVLGDEHYMEGANGTFCREATEAVTAYLKTHNIPYVNYHSSFLGFTNRALSDMKGWTTGLYKTSRDPKSIQEQIFHSLDRMITWTARIYAVTVLKDYDPQVMAEDMKSRNSAELAETFGDNVEVPSTARLWTDSAEQPHTYNPKWCTHSSAWARAEPIKKLHDCPYNNTNVDLSGSLGDRADLGDLSICFDQNIRW